MTLCQVTLMPEGPAAGVSRRSADREDRRRSLISLTAAGTRFCETKARELDAALGARIEPLSRSERAALARCLSRAAAILDKL